MADDTERRCDAILRLLRELATDRYGSDYVQRVIRDYGSKVKPRVHTPITRMVTWCPTVFEPRGDGQSGSDSAASMDDGASAALDDAGDAGHEKGAPEPS